MFMKLLILLILLSCGYFVQTAPRINPNGIQKTNNNNNNNNNNNKNEKKDVFLSRGWGAGGMPFSVLYMNPTTSLTNMNMKPNPDEARNTTTAARNAIGNANATNARRKNTNYNTIPQLFVSYGWGPLGK